MEYARKLKTLGMRGEALRNGDGQMLQQMRI